jgi:hypothetical protein
MLETVTCHHLILGLSFLKNRTTSGLSWLRQAASVLGWDHIGYFAACHYASLRVVPIRGTPSTIMVGQSL